MNLSRISIFRYNLNTYFSLSELKGLAFDLSINPENLHHQIRNEMVMSLIDTCARHDMIPKLVAICRRERPHVDWPDLTLSDLELLRDEAQSGSITQNIEINNSRNFSSKIGDMSGGTFFQGESIVIGGNNTMDCPDCFATGFEHEICGDCGGSGLFRKYIGPAKRELESKSSERGFWRGLSELASIVTEDHSNTTKPRNYVRMKCTKCDQGGVTLLTINENFARKKCPTCKGTKQVSLDLNGNYSSEYSTIIIRRKDNFFLVKDIEVDIYLDFKLIGIIKDKDISIRVKKETHEIQAKYPYSWISGRSKKITFSNKDDNEVLEFLCSVDMPGMSHISVSLRLTGDDAYLARPYS